LEVAAVVPSSHPAQLALVVTAGWLLAAQPYINHQEKNSTLILQLFTPIVQLFTHILQSQAQQPACATTDIIVWRCKVWLASVVQSMGEGSAFVIENITFGMTLKL
jgi:hypothetical protein